MIIDLSLKSFNPYSIQGIVHLYEGRNFNDIERIMFQSLLNTRHCSSKPLPSIYVPIKVSILTQYKALFITNLLSSKKTPRKCFNPYSIQGIVHLKKRLGSCKRHHVSILTQYKALFIITTVTNGIVIHQVFQSLLNTRHCSSP